MEQLLNDHSSQGQILMYLPYVKSALSYGLPFVIGEGNSVACGGMPNVSNVFGSSLWAVDFMMNLAGINVSRMNIHGGGEGAYTAIGYKTDDGVPDVRPLYYAMWLFSKVTANRAVFVKGDFDTSNELIKGFALKNMKEEIVVVFVHKDMTASVDADISVLFTGSTRKSVGKLGFLTAGGLYESNGLSLFGQTFDGSKDGKPLGTEKFMDVKPNEAGEYRVVLPRISVAVLTIPK